MELSVAEKQLIRETIKAMREVKQGTPLKDFMDRNEVENALKLLVKIGKHILQG
jgi:riboflavin synthase alpha subunit